MEDQESKYNSKSEIYLNPLFEHSIVAKDQMLQFSKAPIQDTFGDLPFGEIPEPLKYVRHFGK